MELERIIGKCLAKSPENRYATVGDLSVDIVNLTQGLHSNALTTPRTPARAETRVAPDAGRPSLAWAAAVIFAALALTFGGLYWLDKTDAPGAAPMRFRVALPENARPSSFALSPDGQRLAYSFQDDLWIHDFSADSSARMGPASDQGAPFWSPDGRFLAFAQGGELKKLDIARGITETLCPLTQTLRGGSWSRSGFLLFADQNQTSQGIFRVPETGGRAVQWEGSKTEDGLGHQDFWPQLLPDDGHFIYFRNGESALRIGSLSSGEHRELVESDTGAQYVSSGHLLFVRDGVLRSQAFDAENLSLAGPPVSLADGVQFITGPGRLPATASEVGTLAFLSAGSRSRLTWTDRSDRELRPAGRPREYHSEFRLSPDESQVAIGVRNSYGIDLWLFDSTTGIGRILTPNQRNRVARTPAWSPDALQVAFSYGPPHLNVKRVNTAGDATRLRDPATGRSQYATDWSPDAAFILFQESESTGTDLWVFPTSPDTQPFKIFDTAFNEREGRFSPDGHWIAYSSDESGERRVFVRRFDPSQPSELGSAELVSTDSGGGPAWGPLGKELFYRRSDGMLMAVPVRLEPTFEAGPPVELFQVPGNYDTRDGWRFLTLEPVEGEQSPLNMVVNWPALLNEDE